MRKLLITILIALTLSSSIHAITGDELLISIVHKLEAEVFSARDTDLIESRLNSIKFKDFDDINLYGCTRVDIYNNCYSKYFAVCNISILPGRSLNETYCTVFHELIHVLVLEKGHPDTFRKVFRMYMNKFNECYLPLLNSDVNKYNDNEEVRYELK